MTDSANKKGMTRKEVARRFDISVSTVRNWQRHFKDWLEVEEQAYSGGRKKATTYSDKDVLVFSVIKQLTGPPDHLSFKKVKERLDEELTKATLEAPVEEVVTEEQAMSMVLWTEYSAVVAKRQEAEGALKVVTEERDWLRERITKADDEREQWKEERADLQHQLDEERQKSWLKKLFKR